MDVAQDVYDISEAFLEACEVGDVSIIDNKTNIPRETIEAGFPLVCANGCYKLIIFYADVYNIKIEKQFDETFPESCANGYIKIARWLLAKKHEEHGSGFVSEKIKRLAIRGSWLNGYHEITNWLIEKLNISPEELRDTFKIGSDEKQCLKNLEFAARYYRYTPAMRLKWYYEYAKVEYNEDYDEHFALSFLSGQEYENIR